jgi:hypothetical protein
MNGRSIEITKNSFYSFYSFSNGGVTMKNTDKTIRAAAMHLVRDRTFLYRANQKLGEMGVVGEEKNRTTLFLAVLTKDLDKPVSALLRGPTSSGKNNVVRGVVALVPPESLIIRASLTAKALAYGAESLSGKVLYLYEYRGGKDAQYLTRELQSEGSLAHEYTVVSGSERTTKIAKRIGDPVFLTTTTNMTVFADDDTRFLSLRADESERLTRAVLESKFKQEILKNAQPPLDVWQEALRILAEKPREFRYPQWFEYVAEQVPAGQTRARRDCERFLSLLKAVALCRSFSDGRREAKGGVEIDLADYAVAYTILNEGFSFTYGGAHPQALKVAEAVRELFEEKKTAIANKEIAEQLGWEMPLVYKWVDTAVDDKLIAREASTHEKNLKRLFPVGTGEKRFLPDPTRVLREGQDKVKTVRYFDPLTGKEETLSAKEDA